MSRTYSQWLETHAPLDQIVVAALPPLAELEKLTFNAILDGYTGSIVQTAKASGIELTDAEVEELVSRLVGVEDVPPFTREDYDRHC